MRSCTASSMRTAGTSSPRSDHGATQKTAQQTLNATNTTSGRAGSWTPTPATTGATRLTCCQPITRSLSRCADEPFPCCGAPHRRVLCGPRVGDAAMSHLDEMRRELEEAKRKLAEAKERSDGSVKELAQINYAEGTVAMLARRI